MDTLLHKYVGQRGDIDQTERLLFLNESQQNIALAFFFEELETLVSTLTTTSGTESSTPPTADYYIETMRNRTSSPDVDYEMVERDWDWYNRNHAEDDTGPPEVWVMHGGSVYFHPTPDDTYTMRTTGRKLPVTMTISPDVEPVIPADWHLIVVMQAAVDLLFMYGNDARAITLKNEALSKISTRQEKRTLRRVRSTAQLSPAVIKPLSGRGSRWRRL